MVENSLKDSPPLAFIVLAAGQSKRMVSDIPKVLHPLAGMPMIGHVLSVVSEMLPEKVVVVVPPHKPELEQAVLPHRCAIQSQPLGTGDAVKSAHKELSDFKGNIIVVYGDTPLLTAESLKKLVAVQRSKSADIVVAGFELDNPGPYGRLILDDKKNLLEIVEASEVKTELGTQVWCNSGVMLFSSDKFWPLLNKITNTNSKKEFYLTDCIAIARKDKLLACVADIQAEEALGINTRIELAKAEKIIQGRLREKAMSAGVTLLDPETVYLSSDTKLGRDVTIGPNVVIGPGVEIGNKVVIRAFCHLEQCRVEEAAIVGPFSRLRPNTIIGAGAHIGNFVEIKNADIGRGTKINHLSYIGDAFVGARSNIGAGTITCNYDGFKKYHTHIGSEAFIGSNTSLVAPVKVGDGSYVGAGSVITTEVPAHTLAVARGRQANIEGWAKRFRDEQHKGKTP